MKFGAAISALLLLATTAAVPGVAAPYPGKSAAQIQNLVIRGKLPPHFDPSNLSQPPIISAKAALLMDFDTGTVLWQKNGSMRRAPASTTKILSGLLLIENTAPEDVVTVTDPSITKIEPSSLHLKTGEKLTAQDLLYGLMLRSANDGAAAVALHVSGSIPQFAELMNARARELGATDSQFRNPHGLNDPGHYTTAHDLAVITRAALLNPRFADAVGTVRRTITRSINNKDTVLTAKSKKFFAKFPGADGVKTGFTRAAGHCFVGSATRDGHRLLCVVLGAPDNATADTIAIMSWGFKRYPSTPILRAGENAGEVSVVGGADGNVSVSPVRDLRVVRDLTSAPEQPPVTIELRPKEVEAPIAAGQEIGTAVAKIDGREVSSVPLLASKSVERSPVAAAVRSAGQITGRILKWSGGIFIAVLGVRFGAAFTKGARRRRRRLASSGGGSHRLRSNRRRWRGGADTGYESRSGYPESNARR